MWWRNIRRYMHLPKKCPAGFRLAAQHCVANVDTQRRQEGHRRPPFASIEGFFLNINNGSPLTRFRNLKLAVGAAVFVTTAIVDRARRVIVRYP